eukprot:5136498-Amphidinium_carterae.1
MKNVSSSRVEPPKSLEDLEPVFWLEDESCFDMSVMNKLPKKTNWRAPKPGGPLVWTCAKKHVSAAALQRRHTIILESCIHNTNDLSTKLPSLDCSSCTFTNAIPIPGKCDVHTLGQISS